MNEYLYIHSFIHLSIHLLFFNICQYFLLVPPTLVSHNSPVTTTEGQTAILKCTFSGDEPLTAKWYQKQTSSNDTLFTVNETIILRNSTFVVKESTALITTVTLKAYGIYTCSVNNSYGFASQDVSMMVLCKISFLYLFVCIFVLSLVWRKTELQKLFIDRE